MPGCASRGLRPAGSILSVTRTLSLSTLGLDPDETLRQRVHARLDVGLGDVAHVREAEDLALEVQLSVGDRDALFLQDVAEQLRAVDALREDDAGQDVGGVLR